LCWQSCYLNVVLKKIELDVSDDPEKAEKRRINEILETLYPIETDMELEVV
jgi:hypothetical protein